MTEGQRKSNYEENEAEKQQNNDLIEALKREIKSRVAELIQARSAIGEDEVHVKKYLNDICPIGDKTADQVRFSRKFTLIASIAIAHNANTTPKTLGSNLKFSVIIIIRFNSNVCFSVTEIHTTAVPTTLLPALKMRITESCNILRTLFFLIILQTLQSHLPRAP